MHSILHYHYLLLRTGSTSYDVYSYHNMHSILLAVCITCREVNKTRRPPTCSRPWKFEKKKNPGEKNTKKSAHPKHNCTTRNPHQSGDRDHLETACDETRPTRSPTLDHFLHRSRVRGNRPRLYTHIPQSMYILALLPLLRHLCTFWCSIFWPAPLRLSLP